jgi:hypothetical protein
MLLPVGLLLLAVWALAFLAFHTTAGGWIHVLVVLGVLALVAHLIASDRRLGG